MQELPLPTLVAHADWSMHAAKRWIARARLNDDGGYSVYASENVGDPGTLLLRLWQACGDNGSLLVGFDFPIGLPLAYARKIQAEDFLAFLGQCRDGLQRDFFQVAGQPGEISLRRPFYPDKPGSARQRHLLEALGMDDIDQLRRRCELGRPGQRLAAPLFWTMGGQQVGKAALNGWQEVLIPAAGDEFWRERIKIWPFSGKLCDLIQPGAVVIAETYPAEFYTHLGLDLSLRRRRSPADSVAARLPGSGKRSQSSRQANGALLIGWTEKHPIRVDPWYQKWILAGFGSSPAAEDEFDALVGVFGMLNILLGEREPYDPLEPEIRQIEGWILGRRPGQNPL